MSDILGLETMLVSEVMGASLPELADFDVKPFANHLNLADDQIPVSNPTLVVAVAGGRKLGRMPGGDTIVVVFLAVVPGLDQAVRRQDGLQALFALKEWLQDTMLAYDRIETQALHPVFIGALYAELIG